MNIYSVLFVLILALIALGLLCGIGLMVTTLLEARKRLQQQDRQEARKDECRHCRKVHSGPEDCDRWVV